MTYEIYLVICLSRNVYNFVLMEPRGNKHKVGEVPGPSLNLKSRVKINRPVSPNPKEHL